MGWRRWGQRAIRPLPVQTVVGAALVAAAVGVTFMLNLPERAATVEIVVAQQHIASGEEVATNRQLFATVMLPADTPLRPQLLTWDDVVEHDGAVLARPMTSGEPLLAASLAMPAPAGSVLSLSLPRVAALDGDVKPGETVRIVTVDGSGFVVDVLSVRTVGGGLGRQEQVALTVRVATVHAASRLFIAAENGPLLVVRDGS